MNNNGGKKKRTKKEQDKREREGYALLRDTEKLRRELNLRLLTDTAETAEDSFRKCLVPDKVLYVDSITVTDIRYPDRNKNRKERGTRLWQ